MNCDVCIGSWHLQRSVPMVPLSDGAALPATSFQILNQVLRKLQTICPSKKMYLCNIRGGQELVSLPVKQLWKLWPNFLFMKWQNNTNYVNLWTRKNYEGRGGPPSPGFMVNSHHDQKYILSKNCQVLGAIDIHNLFLLPPCCENLIKI